VEVSDLLATWPHIPVGSVYICSLDSVRLLWIYRCWAATPSSLPACPAAFPAPSYAPHFALLPFPAMAVAGGRDKPSLPRQWRWNLLRSAPASFCAFVYIPRTYYAFVCVVYVRWLYHPTAYAQNLFTLPPATTLSLRCRDTVSADAAFTVPSRAMEPSGAILPSTNRLPRGYIRRTGGIFLLLWMFSMFPGLCVSLSALFSLPLLLCFALLRGYIMPYPFLPGKTHHSRVSLFAGVAANLLLYGRIKHSRLRGGDLSALMASSRIMWRRSMKSRMAKASGEACLSAITARRWRGEICNVEGGGELAASLASGESVIISRRWLSVLNEGTAGTSNDGISKEKERDGERSSAKVSCRKKRKLKAIKESERSA